MAAQLHISWRYHQIHVLMLAIVRQIVAGNAALYCTHLLRSPATRLWCHFPARSLLTLPQRPQLPHLFDAASRKVQATSFRSRAMSAGLAEALLFVASGQRN